jgi:acylphosphatase
MGPDATPLAREAGPVAVEVRLTGRVQGVGFRYFALEIARRLDLTGYVMNLRDGSVRAFAEGPRESLEQFLAVLERGPGGARVRTVQATWGTATGQYSAFVIQPTH